MKVCDIHVGESVFALSFKENLAVFNESRDNDGTVICIRVRVFNTIDTGGGGLFLSVYFQVLPEPSLRRTNQTPHFLFFCKRPSGVWREQNSHDERKKLFVFLACGVVAIALSSCTKSAWERSYSHKSYVKIGDLVPLLTRRASMLSFFLWQAVIGAMAVKTLAHSATTGRPRRAASTATASTAPTI